VLEVTGLVPVNILQAEWGGGGGLGSSSKASATAGRFQPKLKSTKLAEIKFSEFLWRYLPVAVDERTWRSEEARFAKAQGWK